MEIPCHPSKETSKYYEDSGENMVRANKSRARGRLLGRLLGGLLGAFAAHVLSGFCIWFISMSSDFLSSSFLTYLFPAPLVLGVESGLLFTKVNQRQNTKVVFILAFFGTLFGTLISFLASPLLNFSALGDLFNLDAATLYRAYFMLTEMAGGTVFIVALTMFGSLLNRQNGQTG